MLPLIWWISRILNILLSYSLNSCSIIVSLCIKWSKVLLFWEFIDISWQIFITYTSVSNPLELDFYLYD